jgi:hypothetical protein
LPHHACITDLRESWVEALGGACSRAAKDCATRADDPGSLLI